MRKKHQWMKWSIIILIIILVLWILVKVVGGNKQQVDRYDLVSPTPNDTVVQTSLLTGSIEPRDLVPIKSRISGTISELFKQPGDRVQPGDLIARIAISPNIEQVQGDMRRVASAKVSLKEQKEIYEREQKLYEQGISSKEQFERVQAAYRRAEIDLEAAEESLEISRTGSSSSTRQTTNTLVKATVAGIILDQPVKVGQSVIQANNFNDGTTIVNVADLTDLLFVGRVNETSVTGIKVGSKVIIRIAALPKQTYPAVVEYVSPKGEEVSGAVMFDVKAALKTRETEDIRAGFSSNAEVVLARSDGALTIPERCVSYEGQKTYVYVYEGGKEPQQFEKREVDLGISDGMKVEVISGLDAGDKLRAGKINPN